jgi:predicted transcriptional regulator
MKEQVAEIVAAYVRKNRIDTAALPELIASVSKSLANLGQAVAPTAPAPLTPAVSVRRSVTANAVICLDCGFKGLMLRRHLTTAHNLSVDEYRRKWGLASDHPVVARNYAARRSELAKAAGLGTRRMADNRTAKQ